MTGNVNEWCSDFYSKDYYSVSPNFNPTGPETTDDTDGQVFRGGSWIFSQDESFTLTNRLGIGRCACKKDISIGFRIVIPVEE